MSESLCIGDAVNWTHVTSTKGGGVRFSNREGKILLLAGANVLVRFRNGRKAWILRDELRKEGEKTTLTEFFERFCEGISSAPAEAKNKNPDAGASDRASKQKGVCTMTHTQAIKTTAALTCIAYTEAGHICGRPASVLDQQRGGMVCGVHAPRLKRSYEVTRGFLAKVEDLLQEAANHAHKEKRPGEGDVVGSILDLVIQTRRVRCRLEKAVLIIGLLFVSLAGHAQATYVNYRLNFVGGNATTNLVIGTNVLARMANYHVGNITAASATIQYPGGPALQFNLLDPVNDPINKPILGPATITLSAQGSAGVAYFLMQYDVVNTTLPAQGVIVQPAGAGATIALQSSTNLTTWAPATNGTYSAASQNRFFRMSLTLR